MSESLLLPKFLTRELATRVIPRVVGMVVDDAFFSLKRQMLHVVVLVPSTETLPPMGYLSVEPCVLQEYSLNRSGGEWPHPFDEIARSKAQQLWHDRNDGRTDTMPHLLFPGDTPYWGGVKRDGIVVACSGVQPWFDRMISSMVADALIATAYEAWMNSQDKRDGVDFLT